MSLKSDNRVYLLDLFRFIAALVVVLYHYLFRGYSADNLSDLNFSEISAYSKYGFFGINIFFIISGFVISLSIKEGSLIKFVISRVSRLYPVYWICVFLTFIVIILFGAPRFNAEVSQFILNLSMFHNYLRIESIDGVYWTLFIEMKFYIFVIGFYLLLNKFKKLKLDYLIYTWLTLSILYVFFNELLIFRIAKAFFILDWSSYFIAGIIFYQVYNYKLNLKYFLLLSVTLLISLQHTILETVKKANHFNTEFSPIVACSIITLFYLLMLLVACNKLTRLNSSKFIKIGMLTYPLYLLHQKIGYIIFDNLGDVVNKYVLVISTTFLMVVLSYILSGFYEPKVSYYLKSKLKQLSIKYLNVSKN